MTGFEPRTEATALPAAPQPLPRLPFDRPKISTNLNKTLKLLLLFFIEVIDTESSVDNSSESSDQVTSETNLTFPESDHTQALPDQVGADLHQAILYSYQVDSESRLENPESAQINPDFREVVPDSKQVKPELDQSYPESRKNIPESSLVNPESEDFNQNSKQHLSETDQANPATDLGDQGSDKPHPDPKPDQGRWIFFQTLLSSESEADENCKEMEIKVSKMF